MIFSHINNRINGLRINIREKTNPYFAKHRRKKLNRTDFSIISNNCWAGHVYRYFGLPYNSPTIGLYFFAPEYITFLSSLKEFLSSDLQIISAEQSKYFDILKRRKEDKVPIGRITCNGQSVEIVFLHYSSSEDALSKWNRRKERVNFDNLVIKNSFQNLCTDAYVAEFDAMHYPKKVFFVPKPMNKYKSTKLFRSAGGGQEIKNDTIDFKKYVNLVKLINGDCP